MFDFVGLNFLHLLSNRFGKIAYSSISIQFSHFPLISLIMVVMNQLHDFLFIFTMKYYLNLYLSFTSIMEMVKDCLFLYLHQNFLYLSNHWPLLFIIFVMITYTKVSNCLKLFLVNMIQFYYNSDFL